LTQKPKIPGQIVQRNQQSNTKLQRITKRNVKSKKAKAPGNKMILRKVKGLSHHMW